MKLSATQIYKDVFHREPPRSWLEGTPEERQRAIDRFMSEADQLEISDSDFDLFLQTIRQDRKARSSMKPDEEVTAA